MEISGGNRPFRRPSYTRGSGGFARSCLADLFGMITIQCQVLSNNVSSSFPLNLRFVGLLSPQVSNTISRRSWLVFISQRIASNNYAPRALRRSGIPLPFAGLITSNDVSHGKPHPAPYLAGAEKCNVHPASCKYLSVRSTSEILHMWVRSCSGGCYIRTQIWACGWCPNSCSLHFDTSSDNSGLWRQS